MSRNSEVLDFLFATDRIRVNRGAVFDAVPGPVPDGFDFGRVRGMMLGLACGDSLGNISEGMLPRERVGHYGEIRDYLWDPYHGETRGFPSDDTQLAYWSLEQMIEDRGFVPDHVADSFSFGRIFGKGRTVTTFILREKSGVGKMPWYECGVDSASNGALMRIAPVVIPHLGTGTGELWVDAALSAMLTHNSSASISACVAFVAMLRELLVMSSPPEPSWWIEAYVGTARGLEIDRTLRPRTGAFRDYEGTLWRFVEDKVAQAYRDGAPVVDACNSWGSAAFLLETVPSAIYILMRHADDPEEAMVRAATDTKDNDTIAAIVGAAVGALHGEEAIPQRWRDGLSGRTREDDDGRVQELLEEARRVWWNRDASPAGDGAGDRPSSPASDA